jgi:anti-anti-sigma factor
VAVLEAHTSVSDGVAVVRLSGELDLAGAALVERELDRVVGRDAPHTVVVDLRGVAFMDSSGLRSVVVADARGREEGWELVLVRGPEAVHRVFELTRMAERLRWAASPEEAGRPGA